MAAIIKDTGKPDKIKQLEQDFEKNRQEVVRIRNSREKTSDFTPEEKKTLRHCYVRLSALAKQLSNLKDGKEADELLALSKSLAEKAQSFGAVITAKTPKLTFDDVKGLNDVKALVQSFVFMLENPKLTEYYKIEGGLGMLMYGAPGTGKTMFAEAIATKLDLPLFIITPSDIFKSYVGESEAAVRQMFEEIDACPEGAVVFIDECESIFAARKSDDKDYKSAVTTELLQRINGFGVNGARRVMVAATNRPEMIDKAYLRHKRFSHLVHVTPPDDSAKEAIIRSKLKDIAVEGDKEVFITKLLQMASGKKMEYSETMGGEVEQVVGYYSGADISAIVEEACRIALEWLEKNKQTEPIPLTMAMFEKAFAKIPPSISPSLLEEYANFRKNMADGN